MTTLNDKRIACIGLDAETQAGLAQLGAHIRSAPDAAAFLSEPLTGHLDGAVLAALPAPPKAFLETTAEDWRLVTHRSFEDMLFAVQKAARYMVTQAMPGSIVVLSSTAALRPLRHHSLTGTTLAALHAVVRIGSVDLGAHGIRINVVAAGWSEGALAAAGIEPATLAAHVPIARPLRGGDLGALCAFLLSDDSAFMTGAILPLDGGYHVTKAGAATVR